MKKANLIVLCPGNSARSQMAEAFFKRYAGDHLEVHSAGFLPKEINPFAIKVMEEIGYDLSDHYSKDLKEFLGKKHFDIVITICQDVEGRCPTIPGVGIILYWPFEDPAALRGTEEEKLKKFREVRDLLHEQIKSFLKERGILDN